jgi:hypothetical protein
MVHLPPKLQIQSSHRHRTYLDNVRRNVGPYTSEDFDPSEEAASAMDRLKVLLVNPLSELEQLLITSTALCWLPSTRWQFAGTDRILVVLEVLDAKY